MTESIQVALPQQLHYTLFDIDIFGKGIFNPIAVFFEVNTINLEILLKNSLCLSVALKPTVACGLSLCRRVPLSEESL